MTEHQFPNVDILLVFYACNVFIGHYMVLVGAQGTVTRICHICQILNTRQHILDVGVMRRKYYSYLML
jgi:hypothetical protein